MTSKKNIWMLDKWYAQSVVGVPYSGTSELWLWGKQEYGSFGLDIGGTIYRSSPVQLPGATWQTEFYNNQNQGSHVVMAKTDGTLWSWGKNTDWGQLGHNTRANNISSPTQLPGTDWKLGGTTREGSFAIKTDGTLWGWGSNNRGELGQNDRNARSSPTQIPGTTWDKAFGGYNTIIALKTDGELWGIGEGAGGRLGQNSSMQFSSPVQIPGSWSSASMDGAYGAGAIKTDGTLWMFGYNNSGALGQNNTTQYSSPVQIPGTWSVFENAGEGAAGRKTDGTLWTWGTNVQGVLGQNQGPSQLDMNSSPVQIPGTNWNAISFAYGKGMGTKTDGTLWTWGTNSSGILGLNEPAPSGRSSPTQVPGTSWDTVGHGGQSVTMYATKNV